MDRIELRDQNKPSLSIHRKKVAFLFLLGVAFQMFMVIRPGSSQVPTTIIADGTMGTNVPAGCNVCNITGGTRPGNGSNLFHSFNKFDVGATGIANFLNDSGKPTSNILSRVTGGDPSNILGRIQTDGFGHANLFLMNPHGIVFGPDASLNVGGSTHFTTADYLRLADGAQFTAMPSAQDALLSIAPVAAFGFLGTNPGGEISVEGSTLSVEEGQMLSLVGGNITIGSSSLNAPGGKVAVASVASPGEVVTDTFVSAPNVNGESFTTMGNITLSEGATLNVSGDADGGDSAGTIIIRGGRLEMRNARLSSDTGESSGAATAVDIQLTNDLLIETDSGPAITAQSLGSGDAGEVRILSKNMNVVGTTTASTEELGFVTVIDTVSWNKGQAGNVNITTGDLQMTGNAIEGTVIFVDTGVGSEGSGGNIEVAATSLNMKSGHLRTGGSLVSENPLGAAGDVMIASNQIDLQGAQISTQSFANKAGNINIHGENITFRDGAGLSATGIESGTININADHLLVKRGQIESNISFLALEPMPSGGINLMANVIELKEGGLLNTTTIGNSNAGPIQLVATESISLSGSEPISARPSGIFSSSIGFFGPHGRAGNVVISTPKLEINDGARVISATASQGVGGDITINAQTVTINGQQFEEPGGESFIGLGHPLASGIYTSTLGNPARCDGTCGNAGKINITTGSFMLENGAQIHSGTSSTGQSNTITLNASENISISGTLEDGTPGGIFSRTIGTDPGSGKGGDVSLTAGQSFLLKDGATVSSSSSGPGNAGNIGIDVTAGSFAITQGAVVNSGTISTGTGGVITVEASDNISITGTLDGTASGVLSRTTGTDPGSGAGGTIALNAGQSFTLSDGATVSASSDGPGHAGNIGIDVTAGSFAITQGAVVNSGTISTGTGGVITVEASDNISITGTLDGTASGVLSRTTGTDPGSGAGGTIALNAGQSFTLSDGATVSASSDGPGHAGAIAIDVTAGSFAISQGAVVDSGTTRTGKGGAISIHASDNISITGTLDGMRSGVLSRTRGTVPGAGAGGTISLIADQNFTLSDGATVSASSDGPGHAGAIDIDVTAGSFTIAQGAVVDSSTASTGTGGAISVHASDNILITGTLDGTQSGVLSRTTGTDSGAGAGGTDSDAGAGGTDSDAGAGGTISLIADQNFTLSDGATVSASSDGSFNAGDINITAHDTILIDKASVTAEALLASGGNIKLTANDTIHLVDSTIASSVQGAVNTVGGDVTLDPDFIIAQHSQIQAKAKAGQGGNIKLIAKKAVLLDAFTTANLDASSETGISGTVTIESPIQNLSGTIVPLPQNPAPVTALYGTRCVAGEGGHFSTFVDSKVDSLTPTPGTFLASPFLPQSNLSKASALSHADKREGSETVQAALLQVAAYSPPVLFGHGNEMLTACP